MHDFQIAHFHADRFQRMLTLRWLYLLLTPAAATALRQYQESAAAYARAHARDAPPASG